MTVAKTELEMVRRHVREGAKHVSNQRALIDRMTMNGLPTGDAEALLATSSGSNSSISFASHELKVERWSSAVAPSVILPTR